MIKLAQILWAQFSRPSPYDESTSTWLTIGLAHALAGAALASLFYPFIGNWTIIAVGLAYFYLKEMADIRRGGSCFDSLVDTCFLASGGLIFVLHVWWPLFIIVVAIACALWRVKRRGY